MGKLDKVLARLASLREAESAKSRPVTEVKRVKMGLVANRPAMWGADWSSTFFLSVLAISRHRAHRCFSTAEVP